MANCGFPKQTKVLNCNILFLPPIENDQYREFSKQSLLDPVYLFLFLGQNLLHRISFALEIRDSPLYDQARSLDIPLSTQLSQN